MDVAYREEVALYTTLLELGSADRLASRSPGRFKPKELRSTQQGDKKMTKKREGK